MDLGVGDRLHGLLVAQLGAVVLLAEGVEPDVVRGDLALQRLGLRLGVTDRVGTRRAGRPADDEGRGGKERDEANGTNVTEHEH